MAIVLVGGSENPPSPPDPSVAGFSADLGRPKLDGPFYIRKPFTNELERSVVSVTRSIQDLLKRAKAPTWHDETMTPHEISRHITIDPRVCFGKPVVKGTRIWVALVVRYLASGESIDAVLEEYPQLTREDVLACLAFAADMVDFHELDLGAP